MNLNDLVKRLSVPIPWDEGDNIPWNNSDFSRRMLNEHLSQDHNAASRKLTTIDKHVAWIHSELLQGRPTKILDLGCGPGLYSNRLAKLGHDCTGIDFSPASIDYAIEQAKYEKLQYEYIHADLRDAYYGAGYGLAMLIFGELNVFRPQEAKRILKKAHDALIDDGLLLLEPHTYEFVRESGENPPTWRTLESGLFCDKPHIYLQENFWDASSTATTKRYYVIEAITGHVTSYAQSLQAYTDAQYHKLLENCGFTNVRFTPSLTGSDDGLHQGLFVITTRKRTD